MAGKQQQTVKVGNRNYELGSTLGVGGFSEVKRGTDDNTKRRVALKITYTDQNSKSELQTQLRSVQKEIKSMKLLHHANIIRLLGYDLKCEVGGRSAIVMVQELAPRGELFDYLMFTQKFPQNMGISVFHQLISGLAHVHANGIAHRDLKPENLLFDAQFNLKIVDFGFSYNFNKNGMKTMMRTELGTKGYMAPEIINGVKYDEKADIFAAGVILFIMLAGFPPFQNAVPNDWWFDKLMKKKYRLFWMAHERTADFSEEAKALIQAMLSPPQVERPSCEDIQSFDFWSAEHLNKEDLVTELQSRKQTVDEQKRLEQQTGMDNHQEDSRDPFLTLLINGIDALPTDHPITLNELVFNPPRDAFKNIETEDQYAAALETLVGNAEKPALVRQLVDKKLSLDTIDFETGYQLVSFLATSGSKKDDVETIAQELNINFKHAEAIAQSLRSTSLGDIDDYEPFLFDQLAELDRQELPTYNPEFNYKTQGWKTRASFALLTFCIIKYAKTKGASVDIDTDNFLVDLLFTVEKTLELPVEDETTGVIELQEATMELEISMRVNMFSLEEPGVNVFTITNKGQAYIEEFALIRDRLLADANNCISALSLALDSHSLPEPSVEEYVPVEDAEVQYNDEEDLFFQELGLAEEEEEAQ